MNYPQKKTRLSKVYFFWICRDFDSFEWFRSLLLAVEAQDLDHRIEIHTYLTARIKADDATNIMINDANADKDTITGLRSPTNFGRPNWDMIFRGIRRFTALPRRVCSSVVPRDLEVHCTHIVTSILSLDSLSSGARRTSKPCVFMTIV
ncbi:hypothetical protein NXS19_010442 [Fusarium pseudograminearum]|nr:hypothetical protein NXS19_010442 [Fusarium pseudograminearum]